MKKLLFLSVIITLSAFAATWGAWNGITVGTITSNITAWDGITIGTNTSNIGAWNGLNSPSGGPVIKVVTVSSAGVSGGLGIAINTPSLDCSATAASGFGPSNYGIIFFTGFTASSFPNPNLFDSVNGSGATYTGNTQSTGTQTRSGVVAHTLVGTNSMFWSASASDLGVLGGMCLNISGTPSLDTFSTTTTGTYLNYPITQPSTTPSQSGELALFVCFVGDGTATGQITSIPSGYTQAYNVQQVNNYNLGSAAFYKLKTDALAEAPSVTADTGAVGNCQLQFVQ